MKACELFPSRLSPTSVGLFAAPERGRPLCADLFCMTHYHRNSADIGKFMARIKTIDLDDSEVLGKEVMTKVVGGRWYSTSLAWMVRSLIMRLAQREMSLPERDLSGSVSWTKR